MASAVLYPPIVDSYSPAFVAGNTSYCRVYFSLSKFTSFSDIASVQATVVRQDSGLSAVNDKENSAGHYRLTGIILNLIPKPTNKNNLYYVDILNEDLKSSSENYTGWIPGWVYKIQLRLSKVNYDESQYPNQGAWLKTNSIYFSEWSTIVLLSQ